MGRQTSLDRGFSRTHGPVRSDCDSGDACHKLTIMDMLALYPCTLCFELSSHTTYIASATCRVRYTVRLIYSVAADQEFAFTPQLPVRYQY